MSVARAGRRLTAASSCLFVCDIQERFRDLIHEFPSVVSSARTLLAATRELQVPAVVTEQYPKALGKTVPELNVTDLPVFEKKLFSMCTEDVLQHLQVRREI
jgi:nicotinamidase-related amidase